MLQHWRTPQSPFTVKGSSEDSIWSVKSFRVSFEADLLRTYGCRDPRALTYKVEAENTHHVQQIYLLIETNYMRTSKALYTHSLAAHVVEGSKILRYSQNQGVCIGYTEMDDMHLQMENLARKLRKGARRVHA